jgi:hypothetical protein
VTDWSFFGGKMGVVPNDVVPAIHAKEFNEAL